MTSEYIGCGISLGLSLGPAVVGAALHNVVGVALGAAGGAAFGAAMGAAFGASLAATPGAELARKKAAVQPLPHPLGL
jgi:hypothetical protein